MASRSIAINPPIAQLKKEIRGLVETDVRTAYARAINHIGERTSTESKRKIASRFRVPVNPVGRRITLKPKATATKPVARMRVLVTPLQVHELGTPRDLPSVPAIAVGRGTTLRRFTRAFYVTINGKQRVFKRARRSGGFGYEDPVEVPLVGRLPIGKVGVAIEPGASGIVEDEAREQVDTAFEPEFTRQLKLLGTSRGFKS